MLNDLLTAGSHVIVAATLGALVVAAVAVLDHLRRRGERDEGRE
jgi:hypothetical protein